MASSVAAALGASVAGSASASESEIDESDTEGAPSVKGELKRFSNTSFGAEVTGPFVFADGSLLHSLQHPYQGTRDPDLFDDTVPEYSEPEPATKANEPPYDRAGIGYFSGFQFEMGGSNDDFEEVSIPTTVEEQGRVRSAEHTFEILAQARDSINNNEERLGVTQTPDQFDITMDDFEGTQYGAAATNPDCNQFVATNDEGTEGYLFTNWENSPGNVSRIPVAQTDDGEWEADLENAINMANTDALRDLGGTRINCYGDLTPWNTMVSSEENYSHPRVSLTTTVGDWVEAGSGVGIVGAAHFWNRPNPSTIPGDIGQYYGSQGAWYPQGAFALAGVEFLAYYLGADRDDQSADANTTTPIDDVYPNPYRYGYHVDYRDPAGDPPQPIKYYVMGRASWEAPDFQNDLKTVYGCSDGDSKGIYKFVADEEIPSYDDPMDVEGTLYAPKITNTDETTADPPASPADVSLEVEWLPLGHASNVECEEWIAEYDDVTQIDYLETHADTDWEEDVETAIEEADLEVIENGNQNYITNEEIVEWAEQWEAEGHDGVDEELRKVPFLETRAAAKEIGASIEFNKAEGVDSVSDAGPGDYVYFGISEFNDDLSDETGDVQMDRVDGGVVYRGRLDLDYDVSTLEPVIVGPDFTDGPDAANDSLRNVDNVYVMDDGRVLCCEDGFAESGRSYPNDCLYVYQPNPMLTAESVAVDVGGSAESALTLSHPPDVLNELPNVGGQVTVSVADASVATITDASYGDGVTASGSPAVIEDGGAARFPLGPVEEVEMDGVETAIATVTVAGNAAGETSLEVTTPLEERVPEDIEFETKDGTVRVSSDSGSEEENGEDGNGDEDNNGNGGEGGNGGDGDDGNSGNGGEGDNGGDGDDGNSGNGGEGDNGTSGENGNEGNGDGGQ
ncbi:cell surface protein [Salinigranum rubrum]|uniref:Cell surface protein n=2 Tax=Salinigranum rubrum TaxID=755307 RepID=A0A2I8VPK1_9EURY|nr:cell surface protein [Salinigranum rubrum]